MPSQEIVLEEREDEVPNLAVLMLFEPAILLFLDGCRWLHFRAIVVGLSERDEAIVSLFNVNLMFDVHVLS